MDDVMYRAGFGSVSITPDEPMLLAGYGGNGRMHESVSREIFARSLVVEHANGARMGWLSLDLCGVDEETVRLVQAGAAEVAGLGPESLVISSTHNHSAPNVDTTLSLYYAHDEALDAKVGRYTAQVREAAVAALKVAAESLQPAQVLFGQGLAGFGVNRRRARLNCRHLPGPVDHDVPVLAVRSPDGELLGAGFTYACHTTSLSGRDLNGDYAGYATEVLEANYPSATFLFLAGCGANQNPLPRYKPALSRAYGMILAEAVDEVLHMRVDSWRGRGMRPITEPPTALVTQVKLPLQPLPDREALDAWRARNLYGDAMSERIYQKLLNELETGTMATSVPYTVLGCRFGKQLTMLALTGETIVEYGLDAKAQYGWEDTWVMGYCFHLTPYIPTERVLHEGGYEGDQSLQEYGYGAPFTRAVEGLITQAIVKVLS